MKCPKCGYLGFETTDRCRNCQYDFSLASSATEPELALNARRDGTDDDLDLDSLRQPGEASEAGGLDLDRLFGESDTARPMSHFLPTPPTPFAGHTDTRVATADAANESAAVEPEEPAFASEAQLVPAVAEIAPPREEVEPLFRSEAEGALPFDETPIVPPVARPPLAVRRSTPEVPRNRPRTTRPVRSSLALESPPPVVQTSREAEETVKSLLEVPSLGVRVGAGAIDLLLLGAIDAAIVYLTLKVSGLDSTLADFSILPVVPFVGFLALLAFGYVAAFTVAGGQTIGKMILSLRVIGDDGRPIDAAGGMLRALGCMLVPVTFGLSFLPAIFTSDHRAIHDRLAGTRVVQE